MTGPTQDPPSSSSSQPEPEEPLVVLEFSSFEDFLLTCASRISSEGLFLEVEPRERVSSPLLFELRIRDGFRLLKGEGEVIRVHDPLPTSQEPAGLTVRFTSLDEASQRLLPVVLGHYEKRDIPLLSLDVEASGVEVEVISEKPPEQPVAEVTLDDLWEEFEVVADHETDVETEDEGDRSVIPEARLVEADEVGGEIDLEATGQELEPIAERGEPGDLETEADATPEEESIPDDEVTATGAELPTEESDALDLAGVLPTAPGGAAVSSGDLELPPDDPSEMEEESARSWWRRWELWLLLLMAALGILIGLMVYLRYLNDGEWPFISGSNRDAKGVTEELVGERMEPAGNREIIAAYSFENPAELGELSPAAESPAETASLPKMSRRESPPPTRESKPGPPEKRPAPPPTSPVLLTGVDRITWQESQEQTVLTLWGDGPFDTDQLVVFRLDTGTPRQVVKILGVSRPFSERSLEVGTSHVSAVRTGLHTGDVGQELHVVADLEDPEVRMRRVEPEGSQLHVYFSRL